MAPSLDEPAVLVGHSGGGPIIRLLTERRPDLVQRVVFVDAWVLADGECINDGLPEQLAAVTARLVPTPFGWFTEPVALNRLFAEPPPASYVLLSDDQAVPQEIYRAAAARLTDARIVECPGSHEAMLTRPAELATALREATAVRHRSRHVRPVYYDEFVPGRRSCCCTAAA